MQISNHPESLFAVGPSKNLSNFIIKCSQTQLIISTLKNPSPIVSHTIHPVACLAWSSFGSYYGTLVIGLQSGEIQIYDVQKLMERENGLLYSEQIYESLVKSIQVNPFKPHLIAVGGQNEVLILNIEGNLQEPQIFSPGIPNIHEENVLICSVAWNQKIPHILASADNNGLTVVWDLKTNKPIFNFQASSGDEDLKVSLAWNPEIPTQICVGYSNDQDCQIWDLRSSSAPVISFDNSQNVVGLDWKSFDPNILMICQQNKICVWNYKDNQLGSINFTENLTEIKFTQVPGYFAVSNEQNSQIYMLRPSDAEGYAYQWLQKHSGVFFSNSGKLAVIQKGNIKEFKFQPTKDVIYEEILQFEQTFEDDYKHFIEQKAKIDQFYNYLQAKLLGDESVLNLWGFNKKEIIAQAENISGKCYGQQSEEQLIIKKKQATKFNFGAMNETDAESFFDQLGAQEKSKPQIAKKVIRSEEDENIEQQIIQRNINWNAGQEKTIKRVTLIIKNLLIGNYEGAIDCALKCGRFTEAILIAYSKDERQLKNVIDEWFDNQKDPFLKQFFRNFIFNEKEDLQSKSSLDNWQESSYFKLDAAYTLNNVKSKIQYHELLNAFGNRFIDERNDYEQALLCFLLADNLAGIIQILNRQIKEQKDIQQRQIQLIQSIEKIFLFKKCYPNLNADNQTQVLLDNLFIQFSTISFEYQRNIIAYRILESGNERNMALLAQKDMIYNQTMDPQFFQMFRQPPAHPYKIEQIKPEQKRAVQNNQNVPKRQLSTNPNTSQIFGDDISNKDQNMSQSKIPLNLRTVQNTRPIPPVNATIQSTKVEQPSRPTKPFNPAQSQEMSNNLKDQQFPPQKVQGPPTMPQRNMPPNASQNQGQFRPQTPVQNNPQNNPPSQINRPTQMKDSQDSLNASQGNIMDNQKVPVKRPPPPSMNQPRMMGQLPGQNPPQIPQQKIPEPATPMRPKTPQQPQKVQQTAPQQKTHQADQQKVDYICGVINNSKQIFSKIEVKLFKQQNSKRRNDLESSIQGLIDMLTQGELSEQTVENLNQFCQCKLMILVMDQNQNNQATQIYTQITKNDWQEKNKSWIMALKRILLKR